MYKKCSTRLVGGGASFFLVSCMYIFKTLTFRKKMIIVYIIYTIVLSPAYFFAINSPVVDPTAQHKKTSNWLIIDSMITK